MAIGDAKISGDWKLSLGPKPAQDDWLKTEWTGEGQFRHRHWWRRWANCPAAKFLGLIHHALLKTNAVAYSGVGAETLLITRVQWKNGLMEVNVLERSAGWNIPACYSTPGGYSSHTNIDFAEIFD